MVSHIRINFDFVYDRSLEQILERPSQMGQVDSVHGRAHTNHRRQEVNLLLWMLRLQAIDQMQLGANRPLRTGGACCTV